MLSTRSTRLSWNVQLAMSRANCSFPDFSPLKEKKKSVRVRETVQGLQDGSTYDASFRSHKRRKSAQPHQSTSPVRYYHASGNQSQHPTCCPPRVPRHRALQRQTVLRHPSQNWCLRRSSQPWREGLGTNRGLLPCANGMPEDHTGGVLGVRNGCSDGADTGTTLGGVSRTGKWERSGVPGGGRISEMRE